MKVSLWAILAAVSGVVCESGANVGVEGGEENTVREYVTDPDFVATAEKPYNFNVDYQVLFKEAPDGVVGDLYNGETIELGYTFKSLEIPDVKIVGVGGQMMDPVSGETVANITASQIGPIDVVNNEPVEFSQKVGINMNPGKYVLVPAIYVVYEDQLMVLGSRNKLITVLDPQISFFNPQLLLAELTIAATLFAVLYWVYLTFANQYLAGILPAHLLPNTQEKGVKTYKKKKDASKESTPVSGSSEWLPDVYKQDSTLRTRKSRK